MPEDESRFYYEGFTSPNGTIVPDDVFDILAPQLSEAELRVLLYIIRRTFGFKKDADNISLKQMVDGIKTRDGKVLDRGTGMSKSAAARGVKGLEEKGIVIAIRNRSQEKGDEPTTYKLRFRGDPVFSKNTRGVPPKEHPRVLLENTQQTVLQETVEQQTEFSSVEKSVSFSNSNQEGGVGETPTPTPTSTLVDNHAAANIPLAPSVPAATSQPDFSEPKGTSSENAPTAAQRDFRRIGETLAQRAAEYRQNGSVELQEAQKSADLGQPGLEDHSTPGSINSAPRRRGRPRKIRADYLDAVITDFSNEFHDEHHLPSNLTQARNLLKASGMDEERFVQSVVYPARAVVREQGNIRKHYGEGSALRNKMPYFFTCIRDILGIREDAGGPVPPIHQTEDRTLRPGRQDHPS